MREAQAGGVFFLSLSLFFLSAGGERSGASRLPLPRPRRCSSSRLSEQQTRARRRKPERAPERCPVVWLCVLPAVTDSRLPFIPPFLSSTYDHVGGPGCRLLLAFQQCHEVHSSLGNGEKNTNEPRSRQPCTPFFFFLLCTPSSSPHSSALRSHYITRLTQRRLQCVCVCVRASVRHKG